MAKTIFADYITNGDDVRTNLFECAAWQENIRLTQGTYPITGEESNGKIADRVFFSVSGVIVSDYFQSLYCGSPIGHEYDQGKNTGKPATWRASVYAHEIARSIAEDGTSSPYRLRSEFMVTRIDFTEGGRSYRLYNICRK